MNRKFSILLTSITTLLFSSSCLEQRKVEQEQFVSSYGDQAVYYEDIEVSVNEKLVKQYFKQHEVLPGEIEQFELSEADISLELPIILEGLIVNGFKPVTERKFKERMLQFFKINYTEACHRLVEYPDFYLYSSDYNHSVNVPVSERIQINKDMAFVDGDNIICSKKQNFISYPYYVHYLVRQENGKILLNLPKYLIHQNKYILNDDQTSLTWLLNNDQRFIQLLVKAHGYCKEPRINKMVLDKVYRMYTAQWQKDVQALEDLFAVKTHCSPTLSSSDDDGELEIREDLLKYIKSSPAKDISKNSQILSMMYDYGMSMMTDGNNLVNYSFTEEERHKIAAYMGYYIQLTYYECGLENEDESLWWAPGSLIQNEFLSNKKLMSEIEKNNYYNLPDFAHILQKAKAKGGNSIRVADPRKDIPSF